MVFGIKFSGFAAWVFWRTVYLMKLPRLPKKLRVMVGWTLDLFFARDIEQMITLRDVEALGDMAGRIRARARRNKLQLRRLLRSKPRFTINSNERESNYRREVLRIDS